MRIIIISRSLPYVGGREVIIEHLIENLKRKHTILLLTPDIRHKRENVKVVNINRNFKSLEKIVKEFRPDVINCHTFYFFKLARKLSKVSGASLVTTLHGMFLRFYGKDYRSLIKTICNYSDAVTVVSDCYKNELVSNLRVTGKNIFVIKNGVPRNTPKRVSKILLRAKYRIPTGKKVIIVPARISKIKGLVYLVKAANNLSSENFYFLVCSPKGRRNNREKNSLKKKLLKIKTVNDVLRFQEYNHSELQELFSICDACLLPSLMEGISVSLLEAMGMGCLVIATNVGGNPELISNGINGYLIKPRSVNAIVRVLRGLETLSEGVRKEIVKNAKNTIKQGFSNQKMVQSYEGLFSKIDKSYEIKQ